MTEEQGVEIIALLESISEGTAISIGFSAVVVGFLFAFSLLAFVFMRR